MKEYKRTILMQTCMSSDTRPIHGINNQRIHEYTTPSIDKSNEWILTEQFDGFGQFNSKCLMNTYTVY